MGGRIAPAVTRRLAALVLSVGSIMVLVSLVYPLLPCGVRAEVGSVRSHLCHGLPERCLGLPWGISGMCTRCTLFWLGAVGGSLSFMIRESRPGIIVGILLTIPLVVDGTFQYLGFYESTNLLRAATGLSAGVGATMVTLGTVDRHYGS